MTSAVRPASRWLAIAIALRVFAFLTVLLVAGFLLWLPAAPAIAVISAVAQSVSFDVAIPEMAQIPLRGFSLTFENPESLGLGFKTAAQKGARAPLCLDGLLIPSPGAHVTYSRSGVGPIVVTYEQRDEVAAATFDVGDTVLPNELKKAPWIRLEGVAVSDDDDDQKKGPCKNLISETLPIYGRAAIGAEMRPVSRKQDKGQGLLLSGTVNIFARTIELGFTRDRAPRLYPAGTNDISLPPGSRVTEYVTTGGRFEPWAGFVETNADNALDIEVTTPASRLAIIRPGIGLQPEVLSISLFTQLFNDPTLLNIQIVGGAMFAMLQILSSLVSWQSSRRAIRMVGEDEAERRLANMRAD